MTDSSNYNAQKEQTSGQHLNESSRVLISLLVKCFTSGCLDITSHLDEESYACGSLSQSQLSEDFV